MSNKGRNLGKYTLFENNARYLVTFKNIEGRIKFVKINSRIKAELESQKREDKSQQNKFDRHIEHLPLTEVQISNRAIYKPLTTEELILVKESVREIVREIWNLPNPQNRRVYMYIVDGITLTEISKIEKRAIPVIKRSIDRGIKNLQKNLQNFSNKGKK